MPEASCAQSAEDIQKGETARGSFCTVRGVEGA